MLVSLKDNLATPTWLSPLHTSLHTKKAHILTAAVVLKEAHSKVTKKQAFLVSDDYPLMRT